MLPILRRRKQIIWIEIDVSCNFKTKIFLKVFLQNFRRLPNHILFLTLLICHLILTQSIFNALLVLQAMHKKSLSSCWKCNNFRHLLCQRILNFVFKISETAKTAAQQTKCNLREPNSRQNTTAKGWLFITFAGKVAYCCSHPFISRFMF